MGCVSSTLLNHQDDEFSRHIVSLTSTSYGLLTLDPPPPPPPNHHPSPLPQSIPPPDPNPNPNPPHVINSWELMAGLDLSNDSFRFSPLPTPPQPQPSSTFFFSDNKENATPNIPSTLNDFQILCPPKGENRVVLYTTTLRGVRKTFEACNAVRAAIEGFGVFICERDISMDRGFKEELRELMIKGKESQSLPVPPRVFVKGRYIGGVEEVMKVVEEGNLGILLQGLPRLKAGHVCQACGGVRFLPCFTCNGSCKIVKDQGQGRVVLRCSNCNENGLTICPICG